MVSKRKAMHGLLALLGAALVLAAALLVPWRALLRPQGGGGKKIIYIYKTTLDQIEFWRSVSDGIETGAREYGHEYVILGPEQEWDIQGNIEALNRAIAMRPDAIVLVAADSEQLAPYAQKAVDEGILLLTLDSDVVDSPARCLVATDNVEIGSAMAGELLARVPEGPGRVGIIGHVASAQTAKERVAGAIAGLEGSQLTVVPPVYCDNLSLTARTQVQELLARYDDIVGFIATNELAANGTALGLVEAGREDLALITCDNSSSQIAYLEQGVIDATLVQKPYSMGYYSVVFTDALLRNPADTAVPAFYDTGCEVITLENYFTLENQKLLFPFWD